MDTNNTIINTTIDSTSDPSPFYVHDNLWRASLIIQEYFIPIICVFGILGIILTITVLSRKNMCTSTNCHLISMASADLLLLVLYSISLIEKYIPADSRHYDYFYLYHLCFGSVLMQICLLASIWMTVMLAVERYIAICRPFLASKVCTAKKARLIIIVTYVISVIVCLPMFLVHRFETFLDPNTNTTVVSAVLRDFTNSFGYRVIYHWIVHGFLYSILPFVLLIILNGCLIRAVRRSTRYLQRTASANSAGSAEKEEFQITVMLISIIVVFFICQAPYVVYIAMSAFSPNVTNGLRLFTVIATFLLILKSSVNFIIYCWFSEKFWVTLRRIFCKNQRCGSFRKAKSSQNGSYYNLHRQSHCTRDTLI